MKIKEPTYDELLAENRQLKIQLAMAGLEPQVSSDSDLIFKIIAASASDNMFVQDRNLRYLQVLNPPFGTVEEEWLGKTDEDISGKEDAEKLTGIKRKVLETGRMTSLLLPLTSKNGQKEFFTGLLVPRVDRKGNIDGIIGYFRNISESVRSEKDLRLFFDLVPDLVAIMSSDGQFLQLNMRWEEVLGFSLEEIKSRPFQWFLHPDDLVTTVRESEKHLREGKSLKLTNRYRCKNGNYKWLEWIGMPSPDRRNWYASARDITAQREAEEKLKQSYELLSLFIHHSPVYAYIKEVNPEESRVLYASENFVEMIGVPGSQMNGKNMYELFPEEFARKITADDWSVVAEGKVIELEEELNGLHYITIKYPITLNHRKLLAGYTIQNHGTGKE